MASEKHIQSGDVTLHDISITAVNGEVYKVNHIKAELNIYEDIANAFLYGNVVVHDALNLLMGLPITGQETIDIHFQLPGDVGSTIQQTFNVYKITDLNNDESLYARNYIIHFVSRESYKDSQKKIQQAFVGKSVSDIATIIFNTHLKIDKPLVIEATSAVHNLIIPHLSPKEALQWLAKRAYSATNRSSNYMFWEDHDQFNFRTVDSLIGRTDFDHQYYYSPASAIIDKEQGKRQHSIIERFAIAKTTDVLANLSRGMYRSDMLVHDIVRKTYKKYEYDYDTDFADPVHRPKHLEYHTMHNQDQSDFITGAKADYFLGTSYRREFATYANLDTFTKPHMMEVFVQKRDSTFVRFNNFVATVEIPGDSYRKPGDVIYIDMPNPSGLDTSIDKYDKYYTGKFLVTQVRHKITGTVFTTVLQVIKESFDEEID